MANKGKGKAKASSEPSESSPLLGSPSRSLAHPDIEVVAQHNPPLRPQPRLRRSRLASIISTVLIVLFSLFLSAVLFLVLLAASFRPAPSELSALPSTAFKYAPPDAVSVLNVSEAGIVLNISLRCGIDADRALGVQGFSNEHERLAAEEKGERGAGAEWWEEIRRWTARKTFDKLHLRSVQVTLPEAVLVLPRDSSAPLVSLTLTSPLHIPLVTDVPPMDPDYRDLDWLKPVFFTALAKPVASTGELWDFAQRGWADGKVQIVVQAGKAVAELPLAGTPSWVGQFARVERDSLILNLEMPTPRLPGLPSPGRPLDLSSLVTLRSYSFKTSAVEDALLISAFATVPNFIPDINTTIPFGLPFKISLPGADGAEKEMAEVITEPVVLGGPGESIALRMSGHILADLTDGSGDRAFATDSSPLSSFFQRYLHGLSNPIIVRGLPSIPSFAPNSTAHPPQWLLSSLPTLSVPLAFPGPTPPPKIIQSVWIEQMRISESGGKMHASGTVIAEIELPQGMEKVSIDVVAVKPDVLVYDGPADEGEYDDYPPKAFGHIHPDEFLPSTTHLSSDPFFPHRLIVRAPLNDIPLDILPGRDSVLSSFVSKVIFKGGAQAGIKGSASVHVVVTGVDGRMRLDNLPVTGSCWVGRQRLAGFE